MNLKNITPVMTSETAPSPYKVYASSNHTSGTAQPFRAFANSGTWETGAGKKTAWIDLWFNVLTKVDYIKIIPKEVKYSPKQILVYGTNDRVTYTLIHTISNIAQTNYPLLFKIPRSEYKCYRLYFASSNDTVSSNYTTYYHISNIYYYEDLDYMGTSETIKNAIIDNMQNNKKLQQVLRYSIEEE